MKRDSKNKVIGNSVVLFFSVLIFSFQTFANTNKHGTLVKTFKCEMPRNTHQGHSAVVYRILKFRNVVNNKVVSSLVLEKLSENHQVEYFELSLKPHDWNQGEDYRCFEVVPKLRNNSGIKEVQLAFSSQATLTDEWMRIVAICE